MPSRCDEPNSRCRPTADGRGQDPTPGGSVALHEAAALDYTRAGPADQSALGRVAFRCRCSCVATLIRLFLFLNGAQVLPSRRPQVPLFSGKGVSLPLQLSHSESSNGFREGRSPLPPLPPDRCLPRATLLTRLPPPPSTDGEGQFPSILSANSSVFLPGYLQVAIPARAPRCKLQTKKVCIRDIPSSIIAKVTKLDSDSSPC